MLRVALKDFVHTSIGDQAELCCHRDSGTSLHYALVSQSCAYNFGRHTASPDRHDMLHRLVLPCVTHLAHFAAGLRPPVVPFTHIHTLCPSSEEITTQAAMYHFSYIGASFSLYHSRVLFRSISFFHIFSPTLFTSVSISLFHFLASHSVPTLLPLVTIHSRSF